jgi:hypothetical protein
MRFTSQTRRRTAVNRRRIPFGARWRRHRTSAPARGDATRPCTAHRVHITLVLTQGSMQSTHFTGGHAGSSAKSAGRRDHGTHGVRQVAPGNHRHAGPGAKAGAQEQSRVAVGLDGEQADAAQCESLRTVTEAADRPGQRLGRRHRVRRARAPLRCRPLLFVCPSP